MLVNVAAESPIKRFLLFMLCHVIFMCLCNMCLHFRLVLIAHFTLINANEFYPIFLDFQHEVREDIMHTGTLNEIIIFNTLLRAPERMCSFCRRADKPSN